jgi:uncharacterized protein YeaO (DUF488 family)
VVSKATHALRLKRVYAPPEAGDGLRVLVDRLWPRGIAKEKAAIDLWLKDVAPSDALRRGVHDGAIDWKAFVTAYGRELKVEPARSAFEGLRERQRREPVTLLYAARDEAHNNAIALRVWLEKKK